MVDEEFVKRLIDRFESSELVELLGVSIEDTITAFEDLIEEKYEELEDFLLYGK